MVKIRYNQIPYFKGNCLPGEVANYPELDTNVFLTNIDKYCLENNIENDREKAEILLSKVDPKAGTARMIIGHYIDRKISYAQIKKIVLERYPMTSWCRQKRKFKHPSNPNAEKSQEIVPPKRHRSKPKSSSKRRVPISINLQLHGKSARNIRRLYTLLKREAEKHGHALTYTSSDSQK